MLQLPFSLDPHAKTPLYEQLYAALAAQIREGTLHTGAKLPGKRALASALSVSVNTVDTAYQILAAEGYLEARARSGFFVLAYTQLLSPLAHTRGVQTQGTQDSPVNTVTLPSHGGAAAARTHKGGASVSTAIQQTNNAVQTPALSHSGAAHPHTNAAFNVSTSGCDPSLFPFRTWGRIQKELLYAAPELLLRGEAQGDANLRDALAAYLAAYRGVCCAPEQVVVGAGVEYLLSLLAPLLPHTGAVENPGYARAQAILENNGVLCEGLPVDAHGLSVEALRASKAQFCYVTPSHQFPTGVTMPAGRRAALLQWAQETPDAPRYIIEDDYDSEFRFDTRPLPSMQGMGGAQNSVIYLTTFSKSLAPSIRIAAMVLPLPLLPLWRARYGSYASTVSRFEQQTLCRFLQEGYFVRHLARMRGVYKRRRDALVRALEDAFGKENIALSGVHTGLHLLLSCKNAHSAAAMSEAAARVGIALVPLQTYYASAVETCPANTVVLGYGALEESLCAPLAIALKEAFSTASVSSLNS